MISGILRCNFQRYAPDTMSIMPKLSLYFFASACFLSSLCSSYRILVVFPLPGKSHSILGHAFVKTLLDEGHEVTYITAIEYKSNTTRLRQIDVSKNAKVMPTDVILNIEKLILKEMDFFDLKEAFKLMYNLANSTLMNINVQNFLQDPNESFDAVLVEWMYNELYSGFATVFNCPLIWSSSMDPHYLAMSIIDDDMNPIYTADVYTDESPPYNFLQRAKKLWSYVLTRYKKWLADGVEKEIFLMAFTSAMDVRNRRLPSYDEARYNGSIMFGNSHVSSGQSIRLPQNYIPIGGYHLDADVDPLPEDIQDIMDHAEHGVIYFSMGSMLKSKQLPHKIKTDILQIFSSLKQTVIWKFEEQLPEKPKNVHIVQWAPQTSILAHPKCLLFITHGGLLSITETLHFGVPVIGIPIFADQFNNVNRAVLKAFGKRVDFSSQFASNLKEAIDDIIRNSRYREQVKELSFVHHHRSTKPRAEIVHWLDQVVRTRGALHLRSPALHVPFYQKFCLDVVGLIVAVLLLTVYGVQIAFRKKTKNNNHDKQKTT